ncbi:MAG: Coenzyme F420 hydrogenase/dehydrogenase, beta subunit C-terminal domain [Desulfarculaceae bacterium]|nr:Coenzyme F420 hydrogenase/dehydrogenase, beta subunit C-terminal domain [Desulfarculaceae bacterium]MCF8046434.1 Coenzyme F420 hydrogenase/dehydrogenase, beta subunit C-terminal domain [Desulfarculaceae bacterium]MCF8066857.1 Coenzyme F420 hydrogenase/dehydrogenase, beta subunit C-terminal domain [Desulfarculaceae bacterium]MCF8122767.1 Coenzyme F420 hydrogenase/dehydrogenase, beta subunit C-terminal domain [Desulfarculaceae bacterium]
MVPPAASPDLQPTGLERLLAEVINPGLCVACGACLGLCPHLIFLDGQVAAPDACGLSSGRCYAFCPVAQRGGSGESQGPIGPVLGAWQGRATAKDLQGRVQYGGVVSELLALALEQSLVREAVVTAAGLRGSPQGVRVTERAGVLGAAGSVYAGGGALSRLNQALAEDSGHPLALVGLPCQVAALQAMKASPEHPQAAQRIHLVIGLFCTMNLPWRGLRGLLARHGVQAPIGRADFPPPPAGIFQVWSNGAYHELPLEDVRALSYPGCAGCPDLTSEGADLSVGACEGKPGWNTILARTNAGAGLLELAAEKGLLELRPADPASMEHLTQAASAKRKRAAAASEEHPNG